MPLLTVAVAQVLVRAVKRRREMQQVLANAGGRRCLQHRSGGGGGGGGGWGCFDGVWQIFLGVSQGCGCEMNGGGKGVVKRIFRRRHLFPHELMPVAAVEGLSCFKQSCVGVAKQTQEEETRRRRKKNKQRKTIMNKQKQPETTNKQP